MVDACMRSLHATGWINFRIPGHVGFVCLLPSLARLAPISLPRPHFIDYEPGIHYSISDAKWDDGHQLGAISSPIKQVHDRIDGEFIQTWILNWWSPPEHIAQPGE